MKPILPLLAVCALAACGSVPFATRAALAGLDPLTADPGAIRVELVRDADLPLQTQATLSLGATAPDVALSETFALERTASARADGRLTEAFRVAPAEVERLRTLQRDIAALKAVDGDAVRGTLSVAASGCLTDAAPPRPWPVSVYLRLTPAGDPLPVLRDVDIAALGERTGAGPALPCGADALP